MSNRPIGLRTRVLTLTFIQLVGFALALQAKEISLMQYNVENLFDPENPPPGHEEFTPDGPKHWTMEKLKAKLINLGKVVTSVKNSDGSICPDVLTLCEVHNANVLRLWKSGPLKACKYTTTVLDPSDPDPRGIRTALLTRLPLASKPMSHRSYPGGRFMIEIPLQVNNHPLIVFTNHWKSRVELKPGDTGEEKRKISAKVLRDRIVQLQEQNPELDIAAFGDFNDEPENASFTKVLGISARPQDIVDDEEHRKIFWESSFDLMNSPALRELEPERVSKAFKMIRSTYYFARDKAYNQLDHILLSKGLFDDQGFSYIPRSFQVVRLPEFTDPITHAPIPYDDNTEAGIQEKVLHGASDHFPIMIRMNVQD